VRRKVRAIPSLAVVLILTLGAGAAVPGAAVAARARHATVVLRQTPLEITVPGSAALGSGERQGTISATLGTVTVSDTRPGNRTWTTSVSATAFTLAGGSGQNIPNGNVEYWSGPVTAFSGTGTRQPGQTTAAQRVPLSAQRVAFRASKGVAGTSTSWGPTLVITIPATAIAGTYTGTVIHSVA
jgi:hypothetical protein